jgi:DNA (cytosine-5)-methyltransferase 1
MHYRSDDDRHWKTRNLDLEPSLTVTVVGIGGGDFILEETGQPMSSKIIKPPYRVPLMREINALEPNGFKVISTFAGCGGSSLGYRMAGFKVLWASEFIDAARKVYEENATKGTLVDGRDIRLVDPLEVLKALKLKPGELDVLDGSPPCASFSTAGKREKHWGEEKKYSDKVQRTDDLFFEYVRFLKAIKPKVFVAENVSGLVKGTAKGYFLEILREMKACGYRVEARLLDAQWLGVPQARQRIIFQGVREDLDLPPAYPTPQPHRYSVRDALPNLTRVIHDTGGEWSTGDVTNRPSPTITVGVNSFNSSHFKVEGATGFDRHAGQSIDKPMPSVMAKRAVGLIGKVEVETDISGQAIGREYDKLNPGEASEKYFSLVRADANEPSPTVTAAGGQNSGIACVVHPTEKRKFSIAELKRICAFPDDFALSGSYAQQWERLGRAVPPLMMKAIAEAVRDGVLRPAQSRTSARAPRSTDRSTSGSPRKGAGPKRSSPPNAARRPAPAS